MSNFSLPVVLSFFTILAVLGIAFYQLKRIRHSQAVRGETPGGVAGPDHAENPDGTPRS